MLVVLVVIAAAAAVAAAVVVVIGIMGLNKRGKMVLENKIFRG